MADKERQKTSDHNPVNLVELSYPSVASSVLSGSLHQPGNGLYAIGLDLLADSSLEYKKEQLLHEQLSPETRMTLMEMKVLQLRNRGRALADERADERINEQKGAPDPSTVVMTWHATVSATTYLSLNCKRNCVTLTLQLLYSNPYYQLFCKVSQPQPLPK